MARALLQAGADPDAHDPGLTTPLFEVLLYERADAVALLAAHGADLDRPDAVGRIPLGINMSNDPWPVYQVLIEAGANPWQVGNGGLLPAYRLYDLEANTSEDRAIKDAILEQIQNGAPMWPPVNTSVVMQNFLDGTWPTPDMAAAGLYASDEAMANMRLRAR